MELKLLSHILLAILVIVMRRVAIRGRAQVQEKSGFVGCKRRQAGLDNLLGNVTNSADFNHCLTRDKQSQIQLLTSMARQTLRIKAFQLSTRKGIVPIALFRLTATIHLHFPGSLLISQLTGFGDTLAIFRNHKEIDES